MSSVLFVKICHPEEENSSESTYAYSWCSHEVREAFGAGNVTAVRLASDDYLPDLGAVARVLVIGPGDGVVLHSTLEALGRAVAAGAELALPHLLEKISLAQENPPHTVSAFERLEREVLQGLEPRRGTPELPHPIALYRADYLRDFAHSVPGRRLLARDLERAQMASQNRAMVGLCHHYSDYYGKTREDILPFLPPNAGQVLEVGCGRGFTGALLQERLGCRVTGVELNPFVAEDASQRLHRVIAGDALKVDIPGFFDAIVALELFEHLVDGEVFLERAKSLLAPGGTLILSVPNVGHHAIVTDLLAGRWDYVPIGLLCYTHVRFFTRHTLLQWLGQGGFGEIEITAQKTEIPDQVRELAARVDGDVESLATIGFYVVARI